MTDEKLDAFHHFRKGFKPLIIPKTVGDKLDPFKIVGVKPGFNLDKENGESAFENLTEASFPGKWKIIYFYPKDFTFVCPTEIVGYSKIVGALDERGAVLLGGNGDNEFVKLAWRRDHKDLSKLNHWSFADSSGSLINQLGIRDKEAGVPLRATFIIDPENVIKHVTVNTLSVGRNTDEALRILDALQTGLLCACSRPIGGPTL
ncbi:MAG: peroxiredoxin [Deltaproteobacteria bacterium]|jgi:peroxiredoxin (alkyl hydroperoxide reductase subunit C)|nr:peroxiredoxin [Deltaproteobacteria bacterium]